EVIEAARRAVVEYGTGTTGSRTANGTMAIHEELERQFADWFGKRHAIIFSTGYQANLSLIGGLCGQGDVILIDSDSHASIYDATRQTASQVIGFRHNSPESLRKKLERLAGHDRNRLVVVEGLYSIHGDVAPLRDIVDVCRASGSPSNIASVSAALRVLRRHPELRDQLWANIRRLRTGLQDLGYAIGDTESPIVPILTGDEARTIALWRTLLTSGLYVN